MACLVNTQKLQLSRPHTTRGAFYCGPWKRLSNFVLIVILPCLVLYCYFKNTGWLIEKSAASLLLYVKKKNPQTHIPTFDFKGTYLHLSSISPL